ncbi:MAG: hypothetical protein ABSC22_11405 [Roseiarcus sp.]|jgi:hypothetical protein
MTSTALERAAPDRAGWLALVGGTMTAQQVLGGSVILAAVLLARPK